MKLMTKSMKNDLSLMSTFFTIFPDIVYKLDEHGIIIYVSEAVKNYGYFPKEFEDESILDFVHPDDRIEARFRINERRYKKRGDTDPVEVQLITKK